MKYLIYNPCKTVYVPLNKTFFFYFKIIKIDKTIFNIYNHISHKKLKGDKTTFSKDKALLDSSIHFPLMKNVLHTREIFKYFRRLLAFFHPHIFPPFRYIALMLCTRLCLLSCLLEVEL